VELTTRNLEITPECQYESTRSFLRDDPQRDVSLHSNRDNWAHFVRDSFQFLIAATPLYQGSLVFSVQASLA
jgi:hypothetical protein